jgi:hypothetical protein
MVRAYEGRAGTGVGVVGIGKGKDSEDGILKWMTKRMLLLWRRSRWRLGRRCSVVEIVAD